MGVEAVLSECSTKDNKVHPYAFFSTKLSPADRNYEVGNLDLLAIKLALEELRHWLEGPEQPFFVWTDHKNLRYIRTAGRLNSHQARWAMFFTCFNFTLSFHSSSRNVKLDALSCQLKLDDSLTQWGHSSKLSCYLGWVEPSVSSSFSFGGLHWFRWHLSMHHFCPEKDFPAAAIWNVLAFPSTTMTIVPHHTEFCHRFATLWR